MKTNDQKITTRLIPYFKYFNHLLPDLQSEEIKDMEWLLNPEEEYRLTVYLEKLDALWGYTYKKHFMFICTLIDLSDKT